MTDPTEEREDEHLITLYGPEGIAHVSHGGREFEVFDDGDVDVPPEAVEALLAHGFSRTPPAEVLARNERMLAERAEAERQEAEVEAERINAEKVAAARKQADEDAEKADKAEADRVAALKAEEAKTTPNTTSKGAKNAANPGA